MRQTKIVLSDKEIPTKWYNIMADMPNKPKPPLHPGTKQPVGPDDLKPIFPMDLILQEVSAERWIDIPEEVLDIYSLWRPSPMFRAHRLEKAPPTAPAAASPRKPPAVTVATTRSVVLGQLKLAFLGSIGPIGEFLFSRIHADWSAGAAEVTGNPLDAMIAGKGGHEAPVSRDELVGLLQQSLKMNPGQPVVISADRNVRYEEVINVMDMLQQQNVRKVGLLARSH